MNQCIETSRWRPIVKGSAGEVPPLACESAMAVRR